MVNHIVSTGYSAVLSKRDTATDRYLVLTLLKGMMTLSKGSLIVASIPAYNEEKTIARMILLAKKYVDMVVVCDDGSTDMTAKIAENMGAGVLRHKRNAGYGAAIKSLFGRARELGADIMITLDGDGQHDPNEIPLLLKPITEGIADIAVGSRFLKNVKARALGER